MSVISSRRRVDELTASHAKELYAVLRELVPEIETQVPALKTELQPEIHLANLLLLTEIGMLATFDEARARRDTQERALAAWVDDHRSLASRALTSEEIRDLLADEPRDDPGKRIG